MLKVVIEEIAKVKNKSTRDMEVGDFGILLQDIGSIKAGSLVVGADDKIIFPQYKNWCWASKDTHVRLLHSNERIIITQENE